jgi:nanoRNase/pAp phosphatase (c-di-AMP/oligoRNAs hydrolase)
MADFNQFSPIQEALASAQLVFIVLPQNPNYDNVAGGLALYLALKKTGKQVLIASSQPMTVEFSSLVGVDKIKTKPNGRNLIISFDYIEDSIEKVSYNIEGGKFNLVIQPKEGFPHLSPQTVQYSYGGGQADLVFTVGVRSFEDLGSLYKDNQQLFEEGKIINIDINPGNTNFGKTNLVDEEAVSVSEKIVDLISHLKLPVDADIASNLFQGILKATGNFSSPKTTAGTFEAAAFCLRAGARRVPERPFEPKKKKPGIPLKPMSAEVSATKFPVEQPPEEVSEESPSPDWLEPKIFKGNTKI